MKLFLAKSGRKQRGESWKLAGSPRTELARAQSEGRLCKPGSASFLSLVSPKMSAVNISKRRKVSTIVQSVFNLPLTRLWSTTVRRRRKLERPPIHCSYPRLTYASVLFLIVFRESSSEYLQYASTPRPVANLCPLTALSSASSSLAPSPRRVTLAARSASPTPAPRSSSVPPTPRRFSERRDAASGSLPRSSRRGSSSPRDPSSSTPRRSRTVVLMPSPSASRSATSSSVVLPSVGTLSFRFSRQEQAQEGHHRELEGSGSSAGGADRGAGLCCIWRGNRCPNRRTGAVRKGDLTKRRNDAQEAAGGWLADSVPPSHHHSACYGVLRFIMESGAKGCEVVVSGKLRAARAKSMKFTDGFMIHSGQV